MLERLAVAAEEGEAEGLVEGSQRGQESFVAKPGAVVGILLEHGGGLGHIPCRLEALGTGGFGIQHLPSFGVGSFVAAVLNQAVYLLPVGLCGGAHGYQHRDY